MANLAIRGHATRGKEVIKILEMFGGKNQNIVYSGKDTFHYYFIDNETGYIRTKLYTDDCWTKLTYNIFTLEEFLEKFPYKVGDKVLYKYGNATYFIKKMFWEIDKVLYELSDEVYSDGSSLPDTLIFNVGVAQLQPYKEETMEEIKVDIPKGYEFAGVDDDNQQVVFTKIQLEYPKTYEKCCEIMGIEYPVVGGKPDGLSASTYRITEIRPFIYLLVCRDAYWKIAGEQMGLGKPWEPDWKDGCTKYTITVAENEIYTDVSYIFNYVLSFPTEEMRDAFYENFKDLIEQCKELL